MAFRVLCSRLAGSSGASLAKSIRAGVQPVNFPKAPAVEASARSGLATKVRQAMPQLVGKAPAAGDSMPQAASGGSRGIAYLSNIYPEMQSASGGSRGIACLSKTYPEMQSASGGSRGTACLSKTYPMRVLEGSLTANAAAAGNIKFATSRLSFPSRSFFTKAGSGSEGTRQPFIGRDIFKPIIAIGGCVIGFLLLGSLLEAPVPEQHDPPSSPVLFERGDDGLPINFDWLAFGLTPPVVPSNYSYYCGSCWAIVAVQAAESINMIVNKDFTRLSIQQVIDCVGMPDGRTRPIVYGCLGGFAGAGMEYIWQVGLTTAHKYPMNGLQGSCRSKGEPIVFRLDGFEAVGNNELDMKVALLYSPIAVDVYANDLFSMFVGDSILEIEDCPPRSSGYGNHVVLLVGWGEDADGNKFWNIQNTWGEWWGQRGFARLRRGGPDKQGVAGIMSSVGVRPIPEKRA